MQPMSLKHQFALVVATLLSSSSLSIPVWQTSWLAVKTDVVTNPNAHLTPSVSARNSVAVARHQSCSSSSARYEVPLNKQ